MMNLSNLLKLLAISLLLSVDAAAAEDRVATPAELANLKSNQLEIEAKLGPQLDAQFDMWIAAELAHVLTERTTRHLRGQNHLADRQAADTPPAAIPAFPGDLPKHAKRSPSNTRCEMVGHTLECVLVDTADPSREYRRAPTPSGKFSLNSEFNSAFALP